MKINLILRSLLVLMIVDLSNVFALQKEVKVEIGDVVVIDELYIQEEELVRFINAIGNYESNNRYDVVNRHGMMGRYQFSPRTIRYLGYNVTREEFLSDPDLQDEVMRAYLRENYLALVDYIKTHKNTQFKGMYITTASILAGAHFAGAYGMKRFLNNEKDMNGIIDSNGTSLRNYMIKFTDFNIEGV